MKPQKLTPRIVGKLQSGKKLSPKEAQFVYRALEFHPARRLPYASVRSADLDLNQSGRKLAWNNALDLEHNLTIIGWMLRTHLSFVSSFRFQARTPDTEYNTYLEARFAELTKKCHCDIQRQFSLWDMIDLFARGKLGMGDSLIQKAPAGKLQMHEAFNICKGDGAPDTVNDLGLVRDGFSTTAYAIATSDAEKSGSQMVHRTLIPYDAAIFGGYFPRPSATRGLSPLLPAMDFARHYLDLASATIIRSKMEALFGVVIMRDHSKAGAYDFNYANKADAGTPAQQQAAGKPPLEYELKAGQMLKLELEKDEQAKFMALETPKAETFILFREFCRLMLACINLPYSLFDSNGATYSAQRGDFNLYKMSAIREREHNQEAANEAIEHVFLGAYGSKRLEIPKKWKFLKDENGELELPAEMEWECVPTGTYILDASKEIDATIKKLSIGACTYDDAAKEHGSLRSFAENIAIQKQEIKAATAAGVSLVRSGTPGASETLPPDNAPPVQ